MQPAKISIDSLLRTAIEQRSLVKLHYLSKPRIVEPHDYGRHKGTVKLLAYQVGGVSSGKLPNWRWLEVDLISNAEILDKTFPGGRGHSSTKHHEWDEVFARVKPAATSA